MIGNPSAKLLLLIPLYLIPTIIAVTKGHRHKYAIIAVNVLGGLVYGIGWLVALVWSLVPPSLTAQPVVVEASSSDADELEKLHRLMQSGALTEEEYNAKKKVILSEA